jgi:hypothetical protein
MNKKIVIISLLSAILVALLPISSVIGVNVMKSNAENGTIASPLFENRVNVFTDKKPAKISTNYLRKGTFTNLIFSRQSTFQRMVKKAIHYIESRPDIFNTLIQRIKSNPRIIDLVNNYGLSLEEFKRQLNIIQNDPSVLHQVIEETRSEDDAEPLGLSTSNPIGCFIVAIALIPAILIITALIATLTIVTCLNLGGCFESLFEQIGEGIFEGLTPP